MDDAVLKVDFSTLQPVFSRLIVLVNNEQVFLVSSATSDQESCCKYCIGIQVFVRNKSWNAFQRFCFDPKIHRQTINEKTGLFETNVLTSGQTETVKIFCQKRSK